MIPLLKHEVETESKEVVEVERESKVMVKGKVKEIFINESPTSANIYYNFSESQLKIYNNI